MTRQTTPFTNVTANLGRLNRRELEEVSAMVAGLLDTLDDEPAAATALTASNTTPGIKSGRKGCYEYKTINGCGPYKYLRYWSGKTHKSLYIGKAEAKE